MGERKQSLAAILSRTATIPILLATALAAWIVLAALMLKLGYLAFFEFYRPSQ